MLACGRSVTDRQLSIFNYLCVCIICTNIVSLCSTVAFMQHSRVSMQHSRVSMQHSRVLCSTAVFPCSTVVFPCSTAVFHAAQSLIHAAQSLVVAAQPPFHAAEVALTGHRNKVIENTDSGCLCFQREIDKSPKCGYVANMANLNYLVKHSDQALSFRLWEFWKCSD